MLFACFFVLVLSQRRYSYSYSTRPWAFEYEYEYHFIEYEYEKRRGCWWRSARSVLFSAISVRMLIPYTQLAPATLRAIVQEFVTRDGTDHTLVENRITAVLRQLESGQAELHFDSEDQTCQIVPCGGDGLRVREFHPHAPSRIGPGDHFRPPPTLPRS